MTDGWTDRQTDTHTHRMTAYAAHRAAIKSTVYMCVCVTSEQNRRTLLAVYVTRDWTGAI